MPAKYLSIGALSKQTGCNRETIRYYERIGLLADPPRTEGGHRMFATDHAKRLTFIRRSRGLGFTLEQVRELLGMVDGANFTCEQVRGITIEHLQAVREEISDLRRMEDVLATMADQCTGGQILHCPVVEALFEPAPAGR